MKLALLLFLVLGYFAVQRFTLGARKYRLREAIAKKTMIYSSQTVLQMAEEGNVQFFKNKKELNEPIDYYDILKRSAIHNAVKYRRYDVVNFFVEYEYKFNFINDEGMYPIGIAAKNCDDEMIEILKPVSDLNLKDEVGKSWKDYYLLCRKQH